MRHISTTSLDLQWHLDRVVYCTGLQNLGSWVRIPQVPNVSVGSQEKLSVPYGKAPT